MDERNDGVYVQLTDDEGNSFELEYILDLELDGNIYRAFLPTDIGEDDPDFGVILLRVVQAGDEEQLDSIDDEEELARVHQAYLEELFADEEEDGAD